MTIHTQNIYVLCSCEYAADVASSPEKYKIYFHIHCIRMAYQRYVYRCDARTMFFDGMSYHNFQIGK